ncbi:MAG: hypothetical protein KIS72_01640 [Luteimonas sp.]|nr:hypothetical protein [Luteimonas sp.]
MDTIIPILTTAELDGIHERANAPGRLAKSWIQLTRVVRERLAPGGAARARTRTFRNGGHYLVLEVTAGGALSIEFGGMAASGRRVVLGRLDARWDELGLTGPYRILVREREHTLNTFCVVLERYLSLPELA